jgi:hypothetical protein
MRKHYLWRLVFASVLAVASLLLAVHSNKPAVAQEMPVRVLFMHHSTGGGLIWEGNLRDLLANRGYELWDHGYNEEGLVDGSGQWLGINWDVPGDNTDPDGWYHIFGQTITDPPDNTLSHMLDYDVILFKSCFPASDIDSEERFEEYRRYYLAIRDVMDQHSDKLFIPFTTPPLVPNSTSPENAARARRWADFLTSDEYLQGHPNVYVFDFFTYLADENNTLRAEYRVDEWDSHPNTLANQTVAEILADFVGQAVLDFIPDRAATQPLPAVDTSADDAEEASSAEQEEVYEEGYLNFDEIGGFENNLIEYWWHWAQNTTISWSRGKPGYNSDHALHLVFDRAAGGYAGIGVNFAANPDWPEAQGISFYWRADQPDLPVIFALAVQDPDQPDAEPSEAAPFEALLFTPGDEWTQVTIPWTAFTKASWFGDAGVDKFDPANVIWMAFDVGASEQAQQAELWIDNIHLMTSE